MAALPQDIQPDTAAAILRGYEQAQDERHRMHLGASLIGGQCARKLWYTLHWADKEKLSGQKLRLFGSGHLQEPRVVADLRRIGVQVEETGPDGAQWTFRAIGGHFGCSLDGAGLGFPEAPKTWHSLEVKTANQKNYDKLVKGGVKEAKPEHHAQMQVGMGLAKLERAMYICVNKNTDEVYSERVRFDKAEFDRLVARAETIIKANEPPARFTEDPTRFPCKWEGKASGAGPGQCAFFNVCHGTQVPEVNCRTCAHAAPKLDGDKGEWTCANEHLKSMPIISEQLQRTGCQEHRFIPVFLERFAKPVDYVDGGIVVYENTKGERFGNGDGTRGTFASQELRDCPGKALLPEMALIKADWPGAKVVPVAEVAA